MVHIRSDVTVKVGDAVKVKIRGHIKLRST